MPFTVGEYVDEVECDVLPLEVCGLLLGRPWQYDRNAMHALRSNTYSFKHDGKQRTLKPMTDDMIQSDVVLIVRKEKVHKTTPLPRRVKLQKEVQDAGSIKTCVESAVQVDDKPDVPVSDQPVEVQPLSTKRMVDAACSTLPVCVDKAFRLKMFVLIVVRCMWRHGY